MLSSNSTHFCSHSPADLIPFITDIWTFSQSQAPIYIYMLLAFISLAMFIIYMSIYLHTCYLLRRYYQAHQKELLNQSFLLCQKGLLLRSFQNCVQYLQNAEEYRELIRECSKQYIPRLLCSGAMLIFLTVCCRNYTSLFLS